MEIVLSRENDEEGGDFTKEIFPSVNGMLGDASGKHLANSQFSNFNMPNVASLQRRAHYL